MTTNLMKPRNVLIASMVVCALHIPDATPAPARNRAVASGRNDVVYLAPATEPYEAMPLGNGRLGVMVRNQNGMTYLFNPGSFFASADQNQLLISSGELTVSLPDTWMKGFIEQRLVLHDGKVVTRFQTGRDTHTVTSWVAEGLDVLVVEIASTAPLPDLAAALWVWPRVGYGNPVGPETKRVAGDGRIALTTVGLSKARATALLVEDGGDTRIEGDGARMTIPGGGRRSLTILAANPVARGKDLTGEAAIVESHAALNRARAAGVKSLRKQHDEYWHAFWSKTDVLMHSDDGMADYVENLYHLFLFWMAGCSRGSDAPKFNGANYLFCNDWRSWGGQYWYQNTREMYWSLLPADHPELWTPFLDLYWSHLPAHRKLAQDFYGVTGACVQETMNGFDGGGDKGAGNPYTCLYLTTGTEVGHQFYQYYLYTQDKTFLREKAYPMLKETVTYHLHFVNQEADGLYHVYPSDARETYWFIRDSVTDLTALRTVLPILIRESQGLGVDAEQRTHWQDVLDHLAPFVEDRTKGVLLPGTFLDEFPPTRFPKAEAVYTAERRTTKSRGNVSNCENVACEPIYPWGLVGLDSPAPELTKLRQTFRVRPHYMWTLGNSWDPSIIWAERLGLADELLKSIKMFAQNVQTFPCGMAGTPGATPDVWGKVLDDSPAFDSAGVMAAAIPEMNLQSFGGRIRVFPCLPLGWESEFTLLAEGGFLVSSKITKDGTIPFIKILSRCGGPCTVVNPWKHMTNDVFTLATEPGQTCELRPAGNSPAAPPIEVKRNDGPKWPFHEGTNDSAEAYLNRTDTFGMIGICRDGGNPARSKVFRALHPQTYAGPVVRRPARPAFRSMPTGQPPVVDGRVDDACWKDVPTLGPMVLLGTRHQAPDQTAVMLALDDRALYIAAVCFDSHMDQLVARQENDGTPDQSVFGDDSLEIYLQPPGTSYWHVAVNVNGAPYDALVTGTEYDTSRQLDFQRAVTRRADAWVVELAIPFDRLGAKPKPGEGWGFNVGRNHPRLRQVSDWAPFSQHAFHVPAEFGQLIFGGTAEDLKPAASFSFEDKGTGRFVNGAELAPGKLGQALKLSRQAYLEVPDAPALALGDAFTVEAWVWPTDKGRRVVDKCTAGIADSYDLDLYPDNKVRFITPAMTVSTSNAVPLETWTHLAATCDAENGDQRIYVNGALQAEQRWMPPGNPDLGKTGNTNLLQIGAASNGGETFQGMIDEVRIYQRVLAPQEIKARFQNGGGK